MKIRKHQPEQISSAPILKKALVML